MSGHDPLCPGAGLDTGAMICICEQLEQAREQARSIGWQEGYEAGMARAQELYGKASEQERKKIIAAIDGTIAEMVAERRISTYAAARLEAAMGVTYELDPETLMRLEE